MNIVITGASSGIGYATAMQFSENPVNRIIAVSRNKDLLHQLQKSAKNQNILPLAFDIANGNYDEHLWPFIQGNINKVDVLINNAGLLMKKSFTELSEDDWWSIYQTNVFGVVKLIKYLLPMMGMANKSSHVINIGSMGGVQGSVKFPGLSAYSSSKAALAGLTECLAEELKEDNISVNMLALGSVQTEMLEGAFPGYKAPLQPTEIAKFICWFAQEGSAYFNGKILPVSTTTP